jgi:hypothetical protein
MVVRRQIKVKLGLSLRIDQYNFDRVDRLKYLGTILTEDNQITKEIKARIQAGNKCFLSLANLLGARSLSRELKKQLYTTLIRPIVNNGTETWAIRKTDEKRLLVFERKILRRIFGPVKDSITNDWRIRKNEELDPLYQKPNIVEAIRTKRLKWAGHA